MQKLISKVLVLGALLVGANSFAAAGSTPAPKVPTAKEAALKTAQDAVKALPADATPDVRKAAKAAVTNAKYALREDGFFGKGYNRVIDAKNYVVDTVVAHKVISSAAALLALGSFGYYYYTTQEETSAE